MDNTHNSLSTKFKISVSDLFFSLFYVPEHFFRKVSALCDSTQMFRHIRGLSGKKKQNKKKTMVLV